MTDGLQVVASTLFITDVSVDASVSSCAGQIFALSEWDMFAFRVLETLSQTEINDEYAVLSSLIASDEEVIRLNVSVNYSLFMDFLDTLNLQPMLGFW
jgi:hypothetical protein